MDAIEASYVGRAIAWMAEQGLSVRIESGTDEESRAPWCRVTWDRGTPIVGLGRTLPEAVIEVLQKSGDRPP